MKFDIACFWILLILVDTENTDDSWRQWSPCSRGCGGGISQRFNLCEGGTECKKFPQYRICNTQACTNGEPTLREEQCTAQNNIPYLDSLHEWLPDENSKSVCSVICRTAQTVHTHGAKITDKRIDTIEHGADNNGTFNDSIEDGTNITAKLNDTSEDGTNITAKLNDTSEDGSNITTKLNDSIEDGMNITAALKDNIDNSTDITAKFNDIADDGTHCGNRSICIGGKCLEIGCDDIPGTGTIVDVCGVCDGDGRTCRPISSENEFQNHWEVQWLPCSVSCGVGYQKLTSLCKNNVTKSVVEENLCHASIRPKPMSVKCKLSVCPGEKEKSHWLTGVWSPCPVTCGRSYKFRNVVCKYHKGRGCSSWDKPPVMVICDTGVPCVALRRSEMIGYQRDDWTRRKAAILKSRKKSRRNRPRPRYTSGDWSNCSVTCGAGVKQRTVRCQVYLPISRRMQFVPERKCYGKKPSHRETCVHSDCKSKIPEDNKVSNSIEETFSWVLGNYSICTQSCLRGMQRTRLECVKGKTDMIVNTSNCLHLVKPATTTRICNNIPCPARWQTSAYGPCTADCGGGIQKRPVKCVQDVGSGKLKEIPEYRCPDPIPISEQGCNTHFCPARWQKGNWSQCSTTCGPGMQKRRPYCTKSPIRGHTVMVSDMDCMGPKPMTSRECQTSDCYMSFLTPPFIKTENYTFIQFKRSKKVRVTVGGRIILLPGQSVTVTCPVKNYRRHLLFWSKGHKLISNKGRIRTSQNGNLKIKKANPSSDAGVYYCEAGLQKATITVEFLTKSDAKKKAQEMKKYLGHKNKMSNLILTSESDVHPKGQRSDDSLVGHVERNTSKKLLFTTGDWTPCSVTCGSGSQRRDVMCARVTHKYVKILPDRECIKRGSLKPTNVQKCLIQADCPVWKAGKWSQCTGKSCIRDGFAQRKRPVDCMYTNGTTTSLDVCHAGDRPEHKQECNNFDCVSLWKTSKWTDCRPFCGKIRWKTRFLDCMWKTNNSPAWSACKHKPRPTVKKPCKPTLCPMGCVDSSRYCSVVGMLRMCRIKDFRARCCHTCHK